MRKNKKTEIKKELRVTGASYRDGYTLHLVFSDGVERDVDFTKALLAFAKGSYGKYKEMQYFKQFKIENGNVVWGRDWDLIFPVDDLYKGRISC